MHLLAALLFLSLDGGVPETPEPAETKVETPPGVVARVGEVVGVLADVARTFGLFSLLPHEGCGQPQAVVSEAIAKKLRAELSCGDVRVEHAAAADTVVFDTHDIECKWGSLKVKGTGAFRLSRGDERFDVTLDVTKLAVGGVLLRSTLSYELCNAKEGVRVRSQSAPREAGPPAYTVDLRAGYEAGWPIIGSPKVLLTGTIRVASGGGQHVVTLTDVVYVPGEFLPKAGTLDVAANGAKAVRVTFIPRLWRLGQVEVTVEGSKPVRVPMVR